MAELLIQEGTLTAIADAIRGQNGGENRYTPGEMAAAITALTGGGSVISQDPNTKVLSIR